MNWKKLFKRKEVMETSITSAIKALKAIDPSRLINVYMSEHSIDMVYSCVPSIIEYTKLLEECYRYLVTDKVIGTYKVDQRPVHILKRDFYTNSAHMTIDTVDATKRFIEAAVAVLTIYEAKEMHKSDIPNIARNLINLRNIISNLQVLSKEL